MGSTQRPRVGFHKFETYKRHPGKDGANLAYTELVRQMLSWPEIETRPHDFTKICASDDFAREALRDCDVVVTTTGPHAQIYFYLRERLGLDFRIVRDTKTALWNGYLQQETLVAPYLRPDDVLISDSRYSQALFNALFPHLNGTPQATLYPIFCNFPKELEGTWTGSGKNATRRLGFVGRLTDDKNYPDALAVLTELRRRHGGNWELYAVGEHKPQFRDGKLVPPPQVDGLKQFRPVALEQVWPFYQQFDALFFPSTSTCETFGRVMAEAAFVGTPILTSEHGATSEVLEEASLVPTDYRTGVPFSTHFGAPLGDVDVRAAADMLSNGGIPSSTVHKRCAAQMEQVRSIIRGGPEFCTEHGASPTRWQASFISRIRMEGLSAAKTTEADQKIAKYRSAFVNLHNRTRPGYYATALKLLTRSRYRQKTMEFLEKSFLKGEDFTYIGGIDLQLSHLAKYEPRFHLTEPNLNSPA